jgi:hemerythrin-like domain-containing protein
MTSQMNELQAEHKELVPHIKSLRTTADLVDDIPVAALTERCEDGLRFLERHLVPHFEAEESVMYGTVNRLLGSPLATATMRHDLVEIRSLVEQLREQCRKLESDELFTRDIARAIRRSLYALHAVASLHVSKEENVYVPVLERHLSQEEADELMNRMGVLHARPS